MLQGKKTYTVAALMAAATFCHAIGLLPDAAYEMLMGFLGAGAVATMRAAVGRF